ncbi:hypothetical protein [Thermus tengchongensis]|uniref:Uncharacterized protein n=1 Tax=Thermus tengchongensis TaxID=1214928 RepID=A0A4Y9F8Y4_9DEIN|nr:hypothetical protein [Thermus tengchongensis]TFU25626.1 hypothetical protein E0687_09990 [Thermus tengchongensis]
MPRLTDLNGHHEDLLDRVVRYAEHLGWRAVPVVYHGAPGGDALKLVDDPTALYIRTLPDVVLTNGRESILVEVKTHVSARYADATPELLPIVASTALYRVVGVRTLYVYEDPHAGISGAWWAHEVFHNVPVRAVYVGTQRAHADHMARIHYWQQMGLVPRSVPVIAKRTKGSGDPYVVIPEPYLRTLAPWHYVLDDLLAAQEVEGGSGLVPR